MKVKIAKSFIILAVLFSLLAVSGCLFSTGHTDVSPTPVAATPTPPAGTPAPTGVAPTPLPGGYVSPDGAGAGAWTPGPGDTIRDNDTQLFPTPLPGANDTNRTVSPTPSPQPIVSARANDWGASKDTFARGETATGWVYVTNTGNVPINAVDFTIVIRKTIFFVPIEKSYDYSKTGLNIAPGETQQVEFSQAIPAEYSGVSTAGDYQLTVTAKLAGKDIGSFSKNIKVV